MPLIIYFASLWSLSEPVKQTSSTPIMVPVFLSLLMLAIFLWGLTRGNVKDENLPDLESSGGVDDQHDDPQHH